MIGSRWPASRCCPGCRSDDSAWRLNTFVLSRTASQSTPVTGADVWLDQKVVVANRGEIAVPAPTLSAYDALVEGAR